MQLRADWSFPTAIRFGPGRIKELGETCKAAGISSPLLVTDPALAALPMIEAAMANCREAGLDAGLFSDLKANPTSRNVADGAAAYREGRHDGVIAYGGGSALDCAKAIAFIQGQDHGLWHYEDLETGWSLANADRIAPVIAVPTTAGTGSEVGRAVVILKEETHEKKILFHPKMMPVTVISDPELTTSLPPVLTAGTGLDAFAHCIEAYCAPTFHPMSDGIAIEGMRLVRTYLPEAVHNGSNIEARAHMLIAASMGATAFQKGLGAIHSLSHSIGALHDTPHGMTNAVIMPYVLAFNRPAIEEKITRLAAFLAIDGGFDGFMNWLLDFRKEIHIPPTLEAFGVGNARLRDIASMAVTDPTAATNPLPLTAELAAAMFTAAHTGELP